MLTPAIQLRLLCALLGLLSACAGVPEPIRVVDSGAGLEVQLEGQPFCRYDWTSRSKPFFFPILGPTGAQMTRRYPMVDGIQGEAKDHPHHTGLYFAHGDVNGADLWHGRGPKGGRIVQEEIASGPGKGPDQPAWIHSKNSYLDPRGERICGEERRMSFWADAQARYIDLDITVHADIGQVVFGDTKEGTLALRLPATLRLTGPVAAGRAETSAGIEGAKGWGTRGAWAAYRGPVDGKQVTVAIFDHPENHAHPTRWVIRGYGLFAANPFGLSNFEKKPKGTGNLVIPSGGSQRFRYRLAFFAGLPDAAALQAAFARYAGDAAK